MGRGLRRRILAAVTAIVMVGVVTVTPAVALTNTQPVSSISVAGKDYDHEIVTDNSDAGLWLPLHRWAPAMNNIHTRRGFDPGTILASGQETLGGFLLGFGGALYSWSATMVGLASVMDIGEKGSAQLDKVAGETGKALLYGTGHGSLAALVIVIVLGAAAWTARREGAMAMVRQIIPRVLVIGLMTVMIAGSMASTGGGDKSTPYRPGKMSPAWITKQLNKTLYSLSQLALSGPMQAMTDSNLKPGTDQLHCDAVMAGMHKHYLGMTSKDKPGAVIPLAMSMVWEQTEPKAWSLMQFGAHRDTLKFSAKSWCHLAELRSGRSAGAHRTIVASTGASLPGGNVLAFSNRSNTDIDQATIGWAACVRSGGGWDTLPGGKWFDNDAKSANGIAGACQQWWTQNRVFASGDGPGKAVKEGLANIPGIGNLMDLLNIDADSRFDWWQAPGEIRHRIPAKHAGVAEYIVNLHGLGDAGIHVMVGLTFLLSSALVFLVFAALSFGIIASKMVLYVLSVAIFGLLAATLFPNVNTGEKLKQVCKGWVSFALISSIALAVMSILILVTQAIIAMGEALLGDYPLGLILWTGVSPALAIFALNVLFKKVFKLPSIFKPSGMLAWAGSAAGLGGAAMAGAGLMRQTASRVVSRVASSRIGGEARAGFKAGLSGADGGGDGLTLGKPGVARNKPEAGGVSPYRIPGGGSEAVTAGGKPGSVGGGVAAGGESGVGVAAAGGVSGVAGGGAVAGVATAAGGVVSGVAGGKPVAGVVAGVAGGRPGVVSSVAGGGAGVATAGGVAAGGFSALPGTGVSAGGLSETGAPADSTATVGMVPVSGASASVTPGMGPTVASMEGGVPSWRETQRMKRELAPDSNASVFHQDMARLGGAVKAGVAGVRENGVGGVLRNSRPVAALQDWQARRAAYADGSLTRPSGGERLRSAGRVAWSGVKTGAHAGGVVADRLSRLPGVAGGVLKKGVRVGGFAAGVVAKAGVATVAGSLIPGVGPLAGPLMGLSSLRKSFEQVRGGVREGREGVLGEYRERFGSGGLVPGVRVESAGTAGVDAGAGGGVTDTGKDPQENQRTGQKTMWQTEGIDGEPAPVVGGNATSSDTPKAKTNADTKPDTGPGADTKPETSQDEAPMRGGKHRAGDGSSENTDAASGKPANPVSTLAPVSTLGETRGKKPPVDWGKKTTNKPTTGTSSGNQQARDAQNQYLADATGPEESAAKEAKKTGLLEDIAEALKETDPDTVTMQKQDYENLVQQAEGKGDDRLKPPPVSWTVPATPGTVPATPGTVSAAQSIAPIGANTTPPAENTNQVDNRSITGETPEKTTPPTETTPTPTPVSAPVTETTPAVTPAPTPAAPPAPAPAPAAPVVESPTPTTPTPAPVAQTTPPAAQTPPPATPQTPTPAPETTASIGAAAGIPQETTSMVTRAVAKAQKLRKAPPTRHQKPQL